MKPRRLLKSNLLSRLYALDSSRYKRTLKKLEVLGKYETLEELSHGKVSFSRFGEGEFRLLLQVDGTIYEKHSPEKAERLLKVITSPSQNLLLGVNASMCSRLQIHNLREFLIGDKIPDKFYSMRSADDVAVFNRTRLILEQRQYIDSLSTIPVRPKLGDSSCFTMSMYLEEYRDRRLNDVRQLLKAIFGKKRITLVSNNPSYVEFMKKKSFFDFKLEKHVEIPETDAYSRIDWIADSIIQFAPKSDLILLQAGAVGTILASELSEVLSCQILDIGLFRLPHSFLTPSNSENSI